MKKVVPGSRLLALVACATLVVGFFFGCGGQSPNHQDARKSESRTPAAGSVDPCALLSESEIANIVGNELSKGRLFAGPDDCKWDTEIPSNVDILLTAHAAGSVREQVLCPDLRKADNGGQRIAGPGAIAVWKSKARRLDGRIT